MVDLLIKGGRAVIGDAVLDVDIEVTGGRISSLRDDATATAGTEVIDATGLLVLPGSIDSHTHVQWPFLSHTTGDDFYTATLAGAMGGTTMLVDWAVQNTADPDPPEGTLRNAFAKRRAQMDGMAVFDYALHSTLTVDEDSTIEQIPGIIDQGVAVFKLYMTYRKRGIMTDDGMLWDVLQANRGRGTIVSLHAENASMHERQERRMKARGTVTPADWGAHKSAIVESEAIHRAVYLAERVGTPILIRHASTPDGLAIVRDARRRGFPVFAETCPQYLMLDNSYFERPDGNRFICSPPIRAKSDQAGVWVALADGTIDIIGADHASFSIAQKEGDGHDAFSVPNGLPGIETRFPILFSEAYAKGRISLPRLAALTSTNIAKLYGMYPQKGVLLPGSDADIVIVDPAQRRTLRTADLHMVTDYTPYEGLELQGYPVCTISRGRVIARDGQFLGQRGAGRFVPNLPDGWRALDPRWSTWGRAEPDA